MTIRPIYKIEVYTPDDDLRCTIQKHAFNIRARTTLTENVGSFSFSVPVKALNEYKHRNIALHDKVKIWLGWGELRTDPQFVGRVGEITGIKNSALGTVRTIKGQDLGEILIRRLKGMKDWVNIDASVIATELADDLSLGNTEIETDTIDENHRIDIDKYERYFDFLKKVSEYWADAANKVQKDFWVNVDNALTWKTRPARKLASHFTVAKNIISYGVVRQVIPVKNKIYVHGKRGRPLDSSQDMGTDMATPEPGDTTVDAASASGQKVLNVTATAAFSVDDEVLIYDWGNRIEKNTVASIQAGVSLTMTDNLENTYQNGDLVFIIPAWTPGFANVTLAAVNGANEYKVGSRAIEATAVGASDNGMTYMPESNINLNYYPRINFLAMSKTDPNPLYVRLDDSSFNQAWYYTGHAFDNGNDTWKAFNIPAGRDNENSWSVWAVDSGFDWSDIFQITFVADDVNNGELIIDGFSPDNRRYQSSAEDATSQGLYGTREMVVVDENLYSDSLCQYRAEALLFLLKDPVIRADIETRGSNFVQIGDQIPLTIPAEKISAVDYDVVTIEQMMNGQQWRSYYTLLNTSASRKTPSRNMKEYLIQKSWEQREIGNEGINVLK